MTKIEEREMVMEEKKMASRVRAWYTESSQSVIAVQSV